MKKAKKKEITEIFKNVKIKIDNNGYTGPACIILNDMLKQGKKRPLTKKEIRWMKPGKNFGKYYTKEHFLDEYETTNRDEFPHENTVGGYEDFDKDFERINKVEEYDGRLEFSVFLPKKLSVKQKGDDKYDVFLAACFTQSAIYFKTLKGSLPEVFDKPGKIELMHYTSQKD